MPRGRRLRRKSCPLSRDFGNNAGGYSVMIHGEWFFNGSGMYHLADGSPFLRAEGDILTGDAIIGLDKQTPIAYSAKQTVALDNPPGGIAPRLNKSLPVLWKAPIEVSLTKLYLQAGARLYGCGGPGQVLAFDLPHEGHPVKVSWRGTVEGEVTDMLAADNRLFVVTRQGGIYCFGAAAGAPRRYPLATDAAPSTNAMTARAKDILTQSGVTGGYCLLWGGGTGQLAAALAAQSALRIIAIEPDEAKVASLRQQYTREGLYGTRIAVYTGNPNTLLLPPYLAELIVAEDDTMIEQISVEKIFSALRPYGGMACLPLSATKQAQFSRWVMEANLQKAELKQLGGATQLLRAGPLPGSADWTQQYADAGNTVYSQDTLVKAPLGVLWFGGPSNAKILPRHGHGPSPQVAGGRLFILGRDTLTARDVYTGRVLWEAALPGVGKAYDDTEHQPGANTLGSNYVSLPDGIYVHLGSACVRLDPATGRTLATFALPVDAGGKARLPLGYISVVDDLLIVTVEPQIFDEKLRIGTSNLNATSSRRLVVLNRYSGKILWQRDAEFGYVHNAIATGNGKVFCLDRLHASVLNKLPPRATTPPANPALLAFNLRTGVPLWRVENTVFGTWLGYSAEYDLLLQSGRPSRDMVSSESGDRICVLQGRDGTLG